MKTQVKEFVSRVIANKKLNAKFRLVTLESLEPSFSFIPGQFVTLRISPTIFRSYSVASLPLELPRWEILVDITPGGPGTRFIKNLKKGGLVSAVGPLGEFVLQNNPGKKIIFAATGCGLAPYRSMILSLLKKGTAAEISFLWGLRSRNDIVLENMFRSWSKKYPRFGYNIVLSRPDRRWTGMTGHVNEHLIQMVKGLKKKKASVYLCGNNEFVLENTRALKSAHFPKGRIYFESYY